MWCRKYGDGTGKVVSFEIPDLGKDGIPWTRTRVWAELRYHVPRLNYTSSPSTTLLHTTKVWYVRCDVLVDVHQEILGEFYVLAGFT